MLANESEEIVLETLRRLEEVRQEAIRNNDAGAMDAILDDKFIYINNNGTIYDKLDYIRAVRTHELTYSSDVRLTETDHRFDGDVVVLVGMLLGHARLKGEQEVYRLRNLRVWRARGAEWKLLVWQSSPVWNTPSPNQWG